VVTLKTALRSGRGGQLEKLHFDPGAAVSFKNCTFDPGAAVSLKTAL
jgi:hypothetical protein